ncbi:MAG: TonB-dependent receptor plug domain-containing protein, partial [Gemmatimonadaceae bacterium]
MTPTPIAIAVSFALAAAATLPAQEDRRSSLHEVATQSIPAMRREISLDLRRVRLDAALQEIALRAGLPLMYSPEILPKNRTVSLSAEKIEVEHALREVLRTSGLDVIALSSGQVVVVRKDGGDPTPRLVGTVTGRVTDRTTGQPVVAAQVAVAGTRLSRLTDETGQYVLPGVLAGEREVRVMRLGYEAQTRAVTVVDGGSVALDFSLAPLASRLAEVVTTVTGDQRRAEVGHVIGTIDADSLVREAPVTNLTDVINARVPGVQVIQYGGLTGFSPRVRVRGINSVSLGNDPLLVVDGVRVENSTAGTTAFGQSSGRLNDLNPEEIESIELVKGPSAATLYGTDAANGVIVVTTKRGRPGPARWNLYVEQGLIDQPADFPDNYFSWGRNATTGAVQQCPLVQQAAG